MAVDSVSAARLAIYLAFAPFSIFCLFKHGRTGFFGWVYVALFCGLRIVTGAMGLHGDQTSETYLILNAIGSSPLLLSVSGILHEARRATNPYLRRKLDIMLEVQYHALVGLAMILTIISVLGLQNGKSISRSKTLLTVGSALSGVAWGILVLWCVWSLSQSRKNKHCSNLTIGGLGRRLMLACFVTIPVIAIRLAWGIALLQIRIHDPRSEFLTSKAVTVCLSVVPEMVTTVVLLVAGVFTCQLRGLMATPPKNQSTV